MASSFNMVNLSFVHFGNPARGKPPSQVAGLFAISLRKSGR